MSNYEKAFKLAGGKMEWILKADSTLAENLWGDKSQNKTLEEIKEILNKIYGGTTEDVGGVHYAAISSGKTKDAIEHIARTSHGYQKS